MDFQVRKNVYVIRVVISSYIHGLVDVIFGNSSVNTGVIWSELMLVVTRASTMMQYRGKIKHLHHLKEKYCTPYDYEEGLGKD